MQKNMKKNKNDSPFYPPEVTGIIAWCIPCHLLSLWVHTYAFFFPLKIKWRSNYIHYGICCFQTLSVASPIPTGKRKYSLVYLKLHLHNCLQPAFLALPKLSSRARWKDPFRPSCAPLLVQLSLTQNALPTLSTSQRPVIFQSPAPGNLPHVVPLEMKRQLISSLPNSGRPRHSLSVLVPQMAKSLPCLGLHCSK